MPDEGDVVGLHRLTLKFHVRLLHRPITFAVITVDTSRNQVFPCFFTGAGFRKDMIDGKREISAQAILTSMTIAAQNILAREDDFLIRDVNVHTEPDDAGKLHRERNCPNLLAIVRLDEFSLTEVKQNDRLLDVTDTHRLIVLVEDEYLTAQFSI